MRFLVFDFALYVLSGTDLAHVPKLQRVCYAMPGSVTPCATIVLRITYWLSGTELAYAPTTEVYC
eukprot:3483497-Rhodomonas_salina.1